jgi:hypothetical protein
VTAPAPGMAPPDRGDDALPGDHWGRGEAGPVGPRAVAPSRPAGPAGTRPSGRAGQSPRRDRPAADPAGLARSFLRLFLEVEAGQRPAGHLVPLLHPELHARLARVWVRPGPAAVLLTVAGGHAAAGCYEAVGLVRRGRRTTAVAIRLRRTGRRWCVDALARPEQGELPAPAWPVPRPEEDEGDAIGTGGEDAGAACWPQATSLR